MTENITRCPKCATSFRISDAHLKTAKGAVRCGSCLTVFNAKENLVAALEPEPEAITKSEPSPEPETTEQEDFLISDTMEMATPSPASDLNETFSDDFSDLFGGNKDAPDHDFNLFERETMADDDDDDVPQDESWALDLLNDDDTDTENSEQESETDDESEEDVAEYRNSFHLIDETPSQPTSPQEAAKALFTHYDDVDIEEITYAEENTGHTYAQSDTRPVKTDYLSSIEPEPVEFDWHSGEEWWHSKILWGALSVVAGIIFIVQIAWINFNSLSVVEPYRGYYTKACGIVGCQLPALIDRDKIRSANLVVRSHPSAANALIVDAVIQNTAKFEQTFPTMDLVFTDRNDSIVAARRLEPSDYLAGELAGRRTMPVRQPVHIAIEIADPGENATGYRIVIAH